MITFGCITDGTQQSRVRDILTSIEPNFRDGDEILISCDRDLAYSSPGGLKAQNIPSVLFSERKSHITRKKNLIAQYAKNEVLVLLHDYIGFQPGWRDGWEKFGFDWHLGMNVILNTDNTRFRDWAIWQSDFYGGPWVDYPKWAPNGIKFCGRPCLPNYTYSKTEDLYISGAYFLVKRHVLLDNPLDENLIHCESEDVLFSLQVLREQKKVYKMNADSVVKLMKFKDVALPFVELD